jgi:hypothetical protein
MAKKGGRVGRDCWAARTVAFLDRITSHQQVTDVYLLGLAIKYDGVLVTFNRGFKYLARPEFLPNLLILLLILA